TVDKLKAQIEWEDGLDLPDENFLAAINRSACPAVGDFEIGYPEKLSGIVREWSVAVSTRRGRLATGASLLSDDDVIRLCQATSGGSPVYLSKVTSPRFKAAWSALGEALSSVLSGSPTWEAAVPLILK